MGEVNMYRQTGAKPNFSEVARRHGMERKTVTKYRHLGEVPADRPPRPSGFDLAEKTLKRYSAPARSRVATSSFQSNCSWRPGSVSNRGRASGRPAPGDMPFLRR